MSLYPMQLIAEIAENLNPDIIEFFNQYSTQYDFPVDTVIKLVEYTLDNNLNGNSTKEELHTIYDTLVRTRRQKKARWYKTLKRDLEVLSQNDPAYPFARLVTQRAILDNNQWQTLYGSLTLDDLIQSKLAEAKVWQKDFESLFISYPCLNYANSRKLFLELENDTLFSAFQYLNKEYDGSIQNYFLSLPQKILDIPLFAPKKTKLLPQSNGNGFSDTYQYGDKTLETSIRFSNIGDDTTLFVMDRIDYLILATVIQNISVNFYSTRKVSVKRANLAKLLYERPGKKHYETIEQHCANMSKYNFTIHSNGKIAFTFNLIDNVDVRNPDEVIFTFGEMLYNSVIENELTNIKSSSVRLLEQNVSTLLFQPLFRERMLLAVNYNPDINDIVSDFSYSFFTSNVRFPTQSAKKNMDIIEESLKEFVEKGVIVKSFERAKRNAGFRIHFYPLTAEEQADLSYNRFKELKQLNIDEN